MASAKMTTSSAPATTPRSAVPDRRRSNRIPTATSGRLGAATPVRVFDVSVDGVGFHSPTPLDPGSRHPIQIGNGPMVLEGTVRITSVRPQADGTFAIGATFV